MTAKVTYRNVYSQAIDIWEGEFALAYSDVNTKNVYVAFDPMTSVIVNQADFEPIS